MAKNTSVSPGSRRAGLRRLEGHKAKLEALRAALIDGERSGPSTPFDFDVFLEAKRKLPQE